MASEVRKEINQVGNKRSDRHKKRSVSKFDIGIVSVIMAGTLLLVGFYYYQTTRFNSHITINGTNVGGLTANQALHKLGSTVSKNAVYIGKKQIINGKDTKLDFTNKDLNRIKNILKSQRTFFPSSKEKEYLLDPLEVDHTKIQTRKKQIEKKLLLINKTLPPPQDSKAHIKQGKILITKSVNGKQYDIASLLKDYQKQQFKSEIHLKPVYIKPLKEDSPIVKQEEKKLHELVQHKIEYKVQDKVYSLKGNNLIKNASVSKEMKVTIDPSDIKAKVAEINDSQSTLNKNFTFKTHSGSVIQVKGQGFGWAIDVDEETIRVQNAFQKGKNSLSVSKIYGNGWGNEGIGYKTTSNNGIGDSYAEVSIEDQRIWIYQNGQLALTTNVVTGRHNTHEDTHPGVWYILYKKSPSILRGTSVGHGGAYAVKVDYWAPFTNDGQGFHDASWRDNWASNAYFTAGSGGCVNTPPSVMKKVYDNLHTYEPVIIY